MFQQIAAKFEDVVNQSVYRLLSRNGWKNEMVGYGGFGNEQQVRIIGRNLLTPGLQGSEDFQRVLRNYLSEILVQNPHQLPTLSELAERYRPPAGRGWRQFLDASVPFQLVLVEVGRRRKVVRTNRGGYIDVVLSGHELTPGWHQAKIRALGPIKPRSAWQTRGFDQ